MAVALLIERLSSSNVVAAGPIGENATPLVEMFRRVRPLTAEPAGNLQIVPMRVAAVDGGVRTV